MSRTHESNSRRHPDSVVDEIKEAAVELGSNMHDLGGHIRDAAKEKVGDLREQAMDYVKQGREQAMGYVKQGRKKVKSWEGDFENYIGERPIKSLLIAAGVGVVIGYLWRRR